jgi:hypothetical protein
MLARCEQQLARRFFGIGTVAAIATTRTTGRIVKLCLSFVTSQVY